VAAEVGEQFLAFGLSMCVLVALLAALGYPASQVVRVLWEGSAGSTYSLGISFSEATPLILTATAVWLAAQGGLFNIGGDGQLQMGGLMALLAVSLWRLPELPWLLIPAGLAFGVLGGAVWAGIAAVLKAYRGASEIVSTLMLNFIAFIVIDRLIRGPLLSDANPFTPQTDPIPEAARLQALVSGTQLTWGIIVALVVTTAVLVVVRRTTIGLRLQAIGLNADAASYSGIRIRRYTVTSMLVSGALCGLAGALVILGLRYYIAPGWATLWGFQGLLIAFLAMRSPFLIPVWAILFGMLGAAGPVLKSDAGVPDSIVTLMQTLPVIVLFVLYAVTRAARGESFRSMLKSRPPNAPSRGSDGA
jgi:simple sugar transport system permease protein